MMIYKPFLKKCLVKQITGLVFRQYLCDRFVSLAVSESNEFILYAVRNSIHRYDLATGTDQALPLMGLREAVALDFDYDRNCLYWADISLDNIQV